ncbi:polysaccharide biosynthesis/export family protein [Paraflavitalea pollutisoli]|uniref:polysaccharide biosynthesis/export family protein n=1 Tax=Paraflavitalea pollutisoli TaxID=3034143 RepID=UPI0023ED7073|nr:polysaccharide biosynthesis/export family protein [Paraflavitalea sp. H1-2-19X]
MIIFVSGLVLAMSSCTMNKKITYFKDIPDSLYLAALQLPSLQYSDPAIQPNDLLQVSILTLDPQVNTLLAVGNNSTYSVQPGSSNSPGSPTAVTGFLVDREGMIELPIVGKVKVSGLSTSIARDSIHARVALYYNNPVINVRFANFSITVLGEVARPATYIVPNEKVSILDAIGMAGDLTIYGRRENILLVRDSLGQKQTIRFNLNSAETFVSPYFYLRQGDMVYVEPNKSKIASTDAVRTRNISLIATGLSLLIVIISRL